VPSKRDYKRPLTILILFLFIAAHSLVPSRFGLDWPTVALLGIALALLLAPQLEFLLPFVKTLKIGKTEIELREQTTALAISVEKSEESAPQISESDVSAKPLEDRFKRLVSTDVEAHILDLAAKDKQAALMRLAIEIEKEVLLLHGTLGLRNQFKVGNFRDVVNQLVKHGALSKEMQHGLMEFWNVRNQIAHARLTDDSILTSALGSGIRLLRLIKAIPRPRYTIIHPSVPVYRDKACKEPITETCGVIIETTETDGRKIRMIYPAGREFVAGEIVGWDWDMDRVYGEAFYRSPDSGEITLAWSSSAAFVGQTQP
jgi:hypothetical protein